jgi:hypothetical protein
MLRLHLQMQIQFNSSTKVFLQMRPLITKSKERTLLLQVVVGQEVILEFQNTFVLPLMICLVWKKIQAQPLLLVEAILQLSVLDSWLDLAKRFIC